MLQFKTFGDNKQIFYYFIHLLGPIWYPNKKKVISELGGGQELALNVLMQFKYILNKVTSQKTDEVILIYLPNYSILYMYVYLFAILSDESFKNNLFCI